MPSASAAKAASSSRCSTRGRCISKNYFPKRIEACYICEHPSHHSEDGWHQADWNFKKGIAGGRGTGSGRGSRTWSRRVHLGHHFEPLSVRSFDPSSQIVDEEHITTCRSHYQTIYVQSQLERPLILPDNPLNFFIILHLPLSLQMKIK